MTPLRLGFTGTSREITLPQFAALAHWLKARTQTILEGHHGDCIGADYKFDLLLCALGVRRVIHPPMVDVKRAFCAQKRRWHAFEEREPGPYLWRNHQIVDATGALLAAPFGFEEELRSGTWATVRYARTLGRPIRFFWPDGSSTLDGAR